MATPSSMILRALQLTGEKEPGGTLTPEEQTAYLSVLNVMLDGWSIDRLMIYQLSQEQFALTDGDGTYSIGSGADFNTTRPTRLENPCFTRDTSNYDRPLQLINEAQYGLIVLKQTQSSFPEYLFYDHAYSSTGLAQINLYPLPGPDLTLYINSWKQLQQFTTITDTVTLPPGYQRAIEFNLAIELAGGFTNVSQEVAKIARESKAALKGFNAPKSVLGLDYALTGQRRWNINTGD